VSNLEFTRVLGRVLGRPTFMRVPAVVLRLALGELADEALLASTRVEPKRLLESGFRFRFPALEPALRHVLARGAR
jgi:NAD dependent epimerase/dehydratase family enzyme